MSRGPHRQLIKNPWRGDTGDCAYEKGTPKLALGEWRHTA